MNRLDLLLSEVLIAGSGCVDGVKRIQEAIGFVDLIKFKLVHVIGELMILRDTVNSWCYGRGPIEEGRESLSRCVIPV